MRDAPERGSTRPWSEAQPSDLARRAEARPGATMRRMIVAALLAGACAADPAPPTDPWRDDLRLATVDPGLVLPGSTIVLGGAGFVYAEHGDTRLHLIGETGGKEVDLVLDATTVDPGRAEVRLDGAAFAALGQDGALFRGGARVEVTRGQDGATWSSNAVAVELALRARLEPRLLPLRFVSLHVNDLVEVEVEGDGILLGGAEGETRARIWGCYERDGAGGCDPVGPVEVTVRPATPYDRTRGVFEFAPEIAGIRPGELRGTLRLANVHGADAGGERLESEDRTATYTIVPAEVTQVTPSDVSLGQYVEIQGGGFVGGGPDQVTLLEVVGSFTSATTGSERPLNLLLVPEFVAGPRLRYVVSESDQLGQSVNLRHEPGTLAGTIRVVTRFGGDEFRAAAAPFTMRLAPLRQIVYLNFQPSYVESLRHFGLRGMDARIRERIIAVAAQAYAGINLEFRTEPPTDFALYAQVDLAGPDPNGMGLFGYDNTPGKDVGNVRLYDRIGGVNAATQEDGYPGFGGVFVDSLFAFSEHPGDLAKAISGATPLFDAIFDPFRPDQGGQPVAVADLVGAGVPVLTDGVACPAQPGDRPQEIACAVWVLGNLAGTTVAHEVGHSLGLANPESPDAFHNIGDQPNRLMDGGAQRSFEERAQLLGQGPGVFCDEDYEYLRQLMPAGDDPEAARPGCY